MFRSSFHALGYITYVGSPQGLGTDELLLSAPSALSLWPWSVTLQALCDVNDSQPVNRKGGSTLALACLQGAQLLKFSLRGAPCRRRGGSATCSVAGPDDIFSKEIITFSRSAEGSLSYDHEGQVKT